MLPQPQPIVVAMLSDGPRLHGVIPDMISTVGLTCADLPQQTSDQRIYR